MGVLRHRDVVGGRKEVGRGWGRGGGKVEGR